jgi:hypothetical protein
LAHEISASTCTQHTSAYVSIRQHTSRQPLSWHTRFLLARAERFI